MKTICLYTAQFPYGLGEQFLETEIKYLAYTFDRVVIFPASFNGNRRPLPDEVEVLFPPYDEYSTLKGILRIGRWWISCLKDIIRSKNKSLILSSLLRTAYKAEVSYKYLSINNLINDTLHYTYWFDEQSTILAILSAEGKIGGFISRAHRFDLYDEIQKDGYIPYRKFQLQNVTKLFLISQNGMNYMKNKYPKYKSKYELSYLGTENEQLVNFEKGGNKRYRIVSCSRVVDIKRVDLIAKSLSKIKNIPIIWVHFGDGPLLESLKEEAEKILPKNIEVEFKGHVDNQYIFDYYRDSYVDCFVNVSSTEGLPVTIMEAISNGIPIVATDVGGTSEITTTATGVLLDVNCTPEEISLAIEDMLIKKSRNISFRKGVYNFWNENFNAAINYQKFSQKINEINF